MGSSFPRVSDCDTGTGFGRLAVEGIDRSKDDMTIYVPALDPGRRRSAHRKYVPLLAGHRAEVAGLV